MSNGSSALLLDTHIWLWLLNGDERLSQAQVMLISDRARQGRAYLAAISLWEVGMLAAKGRIVLQKDPLQWVQEAIRLSNVRIAPLSPEIAIDSARLPGDFHADPADRLIAATARQMALTLITRDERLLHYSLQGHLATFAG